MVAVSRNAIIGVGSYMLSSIILQVANKIVLSTYSFPASRFLLLLQWFVALICLGGGRFIGRIKFRDLDQQVLKAIAPLSVVFCSNVVFGIMATKLVNLPTMTAVRRFAIWFTLLLEGRNITHKPITYHTQTNNISYTN